MSKLKTVDDLISEVSYSKPQLYRRIKRLIETDLIDPERGGRGQYLLDASEVDLLQRLADLEEDYSAGSAIVQLENERLREKVNQLEDKNQSLENEIVARNNIIQRIRGNWLENIRERFRSMVDWFK